MLVADPAVAIPAFHPQTLVGHLGRSTKHNPSSRATPTEIEVPVELGSDHVTAFAARSTQ